MRYYEDYFFCVTQILGEKTINQQAHVWHSFLIPKHAKIAIIMSARSYSNHRYSCFYIFWKQSLTVRIELWSDHNCDLYPELTKKGVIA